MAEHWLTWVLVVVEPWDAKDARKILDFGITAENLGKDGRDATSIVVARFDSRQTSNR